MKITAEVLDKINTLQARLKLASELNFSETWIRSLLANNKDNGPLTTSAALRVIREETGLNDAEILEEEKVSEGLGR